MASGQAGEKGLWGLCPPPACPEWACFRFLSAPDPVAIPFSAHAPESKACLPRASLPSHAFSYCVICDPSLTPLGLGGEQHRVSEASAPGAASGPQVGL